MAFFRTQPGDRVVLDSLSHDGTNLVAGAPLDMNSQKILSLATGVADTDAAATSQAGGGLALESISSFATLPDGFGFLNGIRGSTSQGVDLAAGGATIYSITAGEKISADVYCPRGLYQVTSSADFTLTAHFDSLVLTGVTGGTNALISLYVHDTHVTNGGGWFGGGLYYDPDKSSGTNSYQGYKQWKQGEDTTLTWSNALDLTDTAITAVDLRLTLSGDGWQFEIAYDTGGGMGAFQECGGGSIATGAVQCWNNTGAAGVAIPSGLRTIHYAIGHDQATNLSTEMEARLTGTTVA